MKKLIRKILQKRGYDITRHEIVPDQPFNFLRFVLKDAIGKYPDFFFVQIGASNGMRGDNLHPVIKEFHPKGLLVEPIPEQFSELQINYADEKQLILENCAISEEDGERSIFRFKKEANLPEGAFNMSSFDKKHLTKFKYLENFETLIEEIKVPTHNMKSLLDKHQIEKVDFMQVDTEGYDYNVLKMTLNKGILPTIINYEHEHLNAADNAACKNLLIDKQYQFITYGRDVLAMLKKN